MRVGIDVTGLFWKYRTGVQNYYYGLIDGLASLDWKDGDPGIVFIDLSMDETHDLSAAIGDRFEFRTISSLPYLSAIHALPSDVISRFGARIWNRGVRSLKKIAALSQNKMQSLFSDIDVFQVWNWEVRTAGHAAHVITVYDVIPVLFPEFYPKSFVRAIETSLLFAKNRAKRVIAISEFTKSELQRYRGIPEENIKVVYPGIRSIFRPISDHDNIHLIRQRYGIHDRPYVLTVGFLDPRKNVAGHIRAFQELAGSTHFKDLQLVLVGPESFMSAQVMQEIKSARFQDRIHVTGYIPDDHLVALLNGASAFVYCSLYEGFGFPALEAMACGVPVVTSNSSALAEVTRGAAVQVDPHQDHEIAAAIERVLTDSRLRDELRTHGLEQAKQFTWKGSAAQHLQVYRECSS